MRAGYNVTTEAILRALGGGKSTAEGLAEALGMGVSTVSTTLLRVYRYGQVDREQVRQGFVVIDEEEGKRRPRYIYLYSLTPAGRDRLEKIKTKPRRKR